MSAVHGLRQLLPARERLRSWLAKCAAFGRWQFAAQALQLLTGLCLVRWLSYEQYAQYGLVVGFQIMLGMLVDLGFTEAIVALVGGRTDEPATVGQYLHAAWAQRAQLLLVLGPLSAFAFYFVIRGHHWPPGQTAALFLAVLAFLYFQGWSAVYSTPLLMHHHIGRLFRPRLLLNFSVLGLTLVLYLSGFLSTVWVAWLNVAAAAVIGAFYRSAARPYFVADAPDSGEARREMRRYLAPLFIGIVFYAVHGQIQTLLIAYFGRSQSLAEVTALGRLGQLLAFASAFITMLVVPAIARAAAPQVRLQYAQVVVVVLGVGGLLIGAAWLCPGLFLLLLGPKYAGLHRELLLTITGSVAAFIAGSLYALNNARKWMSHASVAAPIVGGLLADISFIAVADLSRVDNVLLLSLVTNALPIIPLAITGWLGCARASAQPLAPGPLEEANPA